MFEQSPVGEVLRGGRVNCRGVDLAFGCPRGNRLGFDGVTRRGCVGCRDSGNYGFVDSDPERVLPSWFCARGVLMFAWAICKCRRGQD